MKRLAFKHLVIAALVASAALASCGKNDKKGKLSRLDLGNAATVLTASGGGSVTRSSLTKSATESDMLFKITSGGAVVEVSYYDDEGNLITETLSPVIYDIENHDYFVITFNEYDYYKNLYLVRKSDGSVIGIEDVGMGHSTLANFQNLGHFAQDEKGNLYFQSSSPGHLHDISRVSKIEISGSRATITHLTPDTEWVQFLVTVSAKGDVFYTAQTTDDVFTKVITSNGRVHNLSELIGIMHGWSSWRGLDGEVRFFHTDGSLAGSSINTVNINNNGDISIDSRPNYFWINPSHLITFPNRVILVNVVGSGQYDWFLTEVENPSNTPRTINLAYDFPLSPDGMLHAFDVQTSDNHYYLHGKDAWEGGSSYLLKVNPLTDAFTELLALGVYDIQHFTVSRSDEVTFNAVRKSDGVSILGKFTSTGQFQLIEETNIDVTEMISTR